MHGTFTYVFVFNTMVLYILITVPNKLEAKVKLLRVWKSTENWHVAFVLF